MGPGQRATLALGATAAVAAGKMAEAGEEIEKKEAAKKESGSQESKEQESGSGSYIPATGGASILKSSLNEESYDSLDKDVLKNFANYSDTPISQANDGELSMQMADKAIKNMTKALQAKKATRARIKGGKK